MSSGYPFLASLCGMLDRGGVPPTNYRPGMGGYTVTVTWAQLQTSKAQNTAGTIVGHNNNFSGSNPLDTAILEIRAYNNANPNNVLNKCLVRIESGINAPNWVMNDTNVGSFLANDTNSGTSGQCPNFWKSQYLTYWTAFEAAMVAAYDGVPEIGLVVRSAFHTVFPEPMIRQGSNATQTAAMEANGFVAAAQGNLGTTAGTDQYMQLQDIAAAGVWKKSRFSYTFNPYDNLQSGKSDEAFTEAAMDFMVNGNTVAGQPVFAGFGAAGTDASDLQSQCENNSGRVAYFPPNTGPYPSMYAKGNALGTINHGQTATIARVGDTNPGPTGATYKTCLGFINSFNCGSVELPGGYHTVQSGQTLPPLSISDVATLSGLCVTPDQNTTAPLAPGSPAATGGNTTAALTWTTPNNGGSAILDYTVTPIKDGVNQAPITGIGGPSTQSYTATALVNGHVYAFLIAARNANGTGSTAQTNNVTPQTPVTTPGAPTGVSFVSGEPESSDGSWTPPNSDGGAAIDSYVVTTTPAGPGPQTFTGSPAPTAGTLVGLTDGQAYTATAHAHNSQGAGPESAASAAFTPAAPQFVPGTPVAPSCSPLPGAVTVVLTPPTAGSAATTAYVVTLYVNGVAGAPTTIQGSPPGTALTITGLANGTPVTASFHAVNSVGAGPESPQSAPVTPNSPAPAIPVGAMVQLWTGKH